MGLMEPRLVGLSEEARAAQSTSPYSSVGGHTQHLCTGSAQTTPWPIKTAMQGGPLSLCEETLVGLRRLQCQP